MLVGLALVIASACVFNNYIDRDIDQKMVRTKQRALVSGVISTKQAILYGLILGSLGLIVLVLFTNLLTALVGLIGFIAYVGVYGFWKRRSVHGTLIGSFSGAMPPVIGYCAYTNRLDIGALLLFLMLTFWQMPHFYGIALYRLADYTAADIPVLPAVKGVVTTKVHSLYYVLLFIVASSLLTVFGYAGYTYLAFALLLGFTWLGIGIRDFNVVSGNHWGRGIFRFSLVVITGLSLALSIGRVAP